MMVVTYILKHYARGLEMIFYVFVICILQSDMLNAEGLIHERYGSTCSYILKETHGSISSPHYPIGYPDQTCCSWTIDFPSGDVLVLRVQDVDIEEDANCDSPPCCHHSWLALPQNGTRMSQKICGPYNGRQIIIVPTANATIKFCTSKVVKGGRGFKLTYSVEHEHWCSGWDEVPCGKGDSRCFDNVTQRCNGIKNCVSGIDEMGCGGCGIGEILCVNGDGCYNQEQLCNGRPDCVDFSDEVNCGYCPNGEALCSGDGTKCFNPVLQMCNGKLDCPCGEDEVNCNPICPGKIACANGNGCFTPADLRNDGQTCVDSVDVDNSRVLGIFTHGKFQCDNGHCNDDTDEQTCIKNSVITAAIIGSLTCGLLLVIAVGCMCRLYSLRLAVSNNYHIHHNERSLTPNRLRTPIPHPDEEFFNREPPPAYSVAVSDCQQLQRFSSQVGNSRLFTVTSAEQNPNQRLPHNSNRRSRRHNSSRRRSQRILAGRNSPLTDPAVFAPSHSRSRISNYLPNSTQCLTVPVSSTLETSLASLVSQRESVIVSSQCAENKPLECPTAPEISRNNGERSSSEVCVVDVNPEGDISSSSTSSSSLSPSHDSMTSSTSLMSYLSGNDDDTQLLVLPFS